MKKLNETQKKWALTACLATVLSFNLFMGLAGADSEMANFASSKVKKAQEEIDMEEVDSEELADQSEPRFESIITEKGRLKVKYIEAEDGTTTAIVPKKTESGFCWDKCGKKYLLPKNFTSSKADLELALRKAMVKKAIKETQEEELDAEELSNEDLDEVIAEKAKKINQRVQVDEDEQEEQEDKDLLALTKKCENKEDDSRMTCFANGLTRLLKDKKKEHAKEDVMAMYKHEIEPQLIDALTDMRDSDRREEGQSILEDMLGNVSKKYNYLRERMVKLSALAVVKANQDAQKSFQRAEAMKATNPMQALRLQADGFNRRSMAERMAMDLDYTLQSGLESAQFSNLINENKVLDMYTTQYADIVNPIIQGMRQNPYTYVIQSGPLSDAGLAYDSNGNLVSLDPSLGAIGQMRALGRGIVVMGNGLTPANVINGTTPQIATVNGVNTQAGTATIQVIPATALPANLNMGQPIAAPGTNVISIRGR